MSLPATLTHFWRQRSTAEQRTLALGCAVAALALLYAFVWHPLSEQRQRLQETLPQMRVAAAQLRLQAAEVTRLRTLPQQSLGNHPRSILDVVGARGSIGVPSQLIALDAGRVRVEFNAIAFDNWVDWAKQLQAEHGVRIESAAIIALSEPGMVGIKAVLVGARP